MNSAASVKGKFVGHDNGEQFWVAAAEREDAGRFIVRADEKLTAFLELEAAICIPGVD